MDSATGTGKSHPLHQACICMRSQVNELRKRTAQLPDDYWVVLVGDMITEEALPTYMAMLNTLDGVRDETGAAATPWGRWGPGFLDSVVVTALQGREHHGPSAIGACAMSAGLPDCAGPSFRLHPQMQGPSLRIGDRFRGTCGTPCS